MIYLDYAASTPIDERVLHTYTNILGEAWANPSAHHSLGQKAKGILETARQNCSDLLECQARELSFVATATEANNIILQSFLYHGAHIITTTIEHSSIDSATKNNNYSNQITALDTDDLGVMSIAHILSAIQESTSLISIHLSHNEHGVVQLISLLAKNLEIINRDRLNRIYLHIDAAQSPSYLDVRPAILGVDYLVLSSQKIYSPRGTALLYAKNGSPLKQLINGGGQEKGIRSGTENVASICAFSHGLQLCLESKEVETVRVGTLRDNLYQQLAACIPIRVNGLFEAGNYTNRIANNLHFTLPECDQESALVLYDQLGFCISAGSACTSGSLQTSKAIDLTRSISGASVRVSLGRFSTQGDVNSFFQASLAVFVTLNKSALS